MSVPSGGLAVKLHDHLRTSPSSSRNVIYGIVLDARPPRKDDHVRDSPLCCGLPTSKKIWRARSTAPPSCGHLPHCQHGRSEKYREGGRAYDMQRRPAQSDRKKTAFFPRNARPNGLKRESLQTGNALGLHSLGPVNTNFTNNSNKKFKNRLRSFVFGQGRLAYLILLPVKARWGRNGRAWREGAPFQRRQRPAGGPRAVPGGRHRSLTDIDSRAKESPSPQTE